MLILKFGGFGKNTIIAILSLVIIYFFHCKCGKKTSRLVAIPTINLPINCHATEIFPEGSAVQDCTLVQLEEKTKYKSFHDLAKKN